MQPTLLFSWMLWIVVGSFVFLQGSGSLWCHQCTFAEGFSSNAKIQEVLNTQMAFSEPGCQGNATHTQVTECTPTTNEKDSTYRCVMADFQANLNLAGEIIEMRSIVRRCEAANTSLSPQPGCYPAEEYRQQLQHLLMGGQTVINDLSGNYCFCDRNKCNDGIAANMFTSSTSVHASTAAHNVAHEAFCVILSFSALSLLRLR